MFKASYHFFPYALAVESLRKILLILYRSIPRSRINDFSLKDGWQSLKDFEQCEIVAFV
jgi:hypothetical protein